MIEYFLNLCNLAWADSVQLWWMWVIFILVMIYLHRRNDDGSRPGIP